MQVLADFLQGVLQASRLFSDELLCACLDLLLAAPPSLVPIQARFCHRLRVCRSVKCTLPDREGSADNVVDVKDQYLGLKLAVTTS